VIVQTDHKPLVTIAKKEINKVSGRLQVMLIKLMKYQPTVQYVPGKQMFLADTLSRVFLKDPVQEDNDIKSVIHFVSKHLAVSSEKRKALRDATNKDEVFKQVMQYHLQGWPEYIQNVSFGTQLYWNFRQDILIDDGLIFVKDRLVIPSSMRLEILRSLHEGYLGEEKCKKNARSLLFWPGLSTDIEAMVSSCNICQQFRRVNEKEPMISHDIPLRPWAKVATDILDFGGSSYLVIVDYYSKWLELEKLPRKTASEVIQKLKEVFSRLGVPEEIVSDNMPFGSAEMKRFGIEWDIKLTTSSLRYSQSNGMAERAVQIAKNILRRASTGRADLSTMLLDYRNTPVKGMSISPAQLCTGRRLRTKIPVITSKLEPTVPVGVKEELRRKQAVEKVYYDRSARQLPNLNVGDKVLLKTSKTLEFARVTGKHQTPRSFFVTTADGSEYRRNRSHLIKPKHEPTDFYIDPLPGLINQKQPSPDTSQSSESSDATFSQRTERESSTHQQFEETLNGQRRLLLRSRDNLRTPSRFHDFVTFK